MIMGNRFAHALIIGIEYEHCDTSTSRFTAIVGMSRNLALSRWLHRLYPGNRFGGRHVSRL